MFGSLHFLWTFVQSLFSIPVEKKITAQFIAETNLPTLTGKFKVRAYKITTPGLGVSEPIAVVVGDVEGKERIPVRVHDACFTSEVLGSTKCDCREQLEYSMDYIRKSGPGVVIYLQQEGRGIGLANKIAAYSLQEIGYDTVEANRKLGLPDDSRSYTAVVDILSDLKIQSIQLLTNNPRKIDCLRKLGINVTNRLPVHIPPNEDNVNYLRTKVLKMNHQITEKFLAIHDS